MEFSLSAPDYTRRLDRLHTLFLHLGQKLVQDRHLAAVHHQVEVGRVGGSGLGAVKKVRVVAALPQLHEDVQQTHLVHLARRVQDVDVLHQNLCVPDGSEPRALQSAAPRLSPGSCRVWVGLHCLPLSLHLAQANVHLDLSFRKQGFLHVSFYTSEQEGTQNLKEGLKKLYRNIFTQITQADSDE